jgi:YgiT-type zinc finger domain-containing protein
MPEHERCPVCDQGELVWEARDVPFTYEGLRTVIKNVRGNWCRHCGEGVFRASDDDDADRMSEEMVRFVKAVKSSA